MNDLCFIVFEFQLVPNQVPNQESQMPMHKSVELWVLPDVRWGRVPDARWEMLPDAGCGEG